MLSQDHIFSVHLSLSIVEMMVKKRKQKNKNYIYNYFKNMYEVCKFGFQLYCDFALDKIIYMDFINSNEKLYSVAVVFPKIRLSRNYIVIRNKNEHN